MKQRTLIAAAGVLALTSFGAHAQTPAPQLTMDSGFYLGAGAGRAHLDVNCTSACETRDTAWGVYAGYQFNRYFAIEAGYNDFGTMTTAATLFGVTANIRQSTTVWEVDALAIAPVSDKFSMFAKIGMYRYDTDASSSGAFVSTSSGKGTEFTLGLGAQWAFTPNLAARMEWQRYNDVGTGSVGLEEATVSLWRLSGRYKF